MLNLSKTVFLQSKRGLVLIVKMNTKILNFSEPKRRADEHKGLWVREHLS